MAILAAVTVVVALISQVTLENAVESYIGYYAQNILFMRGAPTAENILINIFYMTKFCEETK